VAVVVVFPLKVEPVPQGVTGVGDEGADEEGDEREVGDAEGPAVPLGVDDGVGFKVGVQDGVEETNVPE
jgi:hypothetical protein